MKQPYHFKLRLRMAKYAFLIVYWGLILNNEYKSDFYYDKCMSLNEEIG